MGPGMPAGLEPRSGRQTRGGTQPAADLSSGAAGWRRGQLLIGQDGDQFTDQRPSEADTNGQSGREE